MAEVGYDRMTVDALAARAGVSKPTIYRRWPGGKKEIIVDAIRAKRAEAGALPDTGSLRGDLLALLGAMIEHIDEDAHVAGGLISQLRASEELARALPRRGRRRRAAALRRAARARRARGEISADARSRRCSPTSPARSSSPARS